MAILPLNYQKQDRSILGAHLTEKSYFFMQDYRKVRCSDFVNTSQPTFLAKLPQKTIQSILQIKDRAIYLQKQGI